MAETKAVDGAAPTPTSGKKKNSKKQKTEPAADEADLAASANHQTTHNDDAPSKGSGKKQKNETDKGNEGQKHTFVFTLLPLVSSPLSCVATVNREHRGEAQGAAVWPVQPGSV